MVDEFSAFARMPVPEMSKANIKQTVRETVFLQKVGFPDIEFVMETEKGPLEMVYDNRMLIIDVIDNGKGLPETNRQRLLEPYMTTREKGTGLGLAIVRKIAEDHGGTIELMDAPQVAEGGHGAMMRFTLPIEKEVSQENNKTKETI